MSAKRTSDVDPVQAKSAFLTSYMSNHADTLVAYISHHLAAAKPSKNAIPAHSIREPRMLKITSQEMELQYKDATDKNAVKSVQISFDPPLEGYEEVRPRLLQMKLEAESAIGMAKRPIITAYRPPARRNALISMSLLLLWVGCATQDDDHNFGRIRQLLGGWAAIRVTGIFILIAHFAEAAFQFRSCQKYSVPLPQTILWTISTLITGFASLLRFRQIVQEARIASVHKTK